MHSYQAPAPEALLPAAQEPIAAASKPAKDLPSSLPIICNGMKGTLDVRRMMCTGPDGRQITPTEFERLGGRGAAKKCAQCTQ